MNKNITIGEKTPMGGICDIPDVVDNIAFSVIQKSKRHGLGLFSSRDLRKGEILGTLDGQYISKELYEQIKKQTPANLHDYLFVEWNAISPFTLLVRNFRTKYSFINHSRQPNLKIYIDDMSIRTIEPIPKNWELTLDYRMEPLGCEYIDGPGKDYL